MAPKRSTPLDDPPSASSDDDETENEQEEQIAQKTNEESESEDEDDEEEDDEEEEEATNLVKNPLEKPKIENPSSRTEESSSEDESGSEPEEEEIATPVEKSKTLNPKSSSISESEPDFRSPTASDFAIKPSKKISVLETPENTPNSKRPSSESDMNSKKKIKVSNGEIDEEKKSAIKRVWSDDDEILLLQGFIQFQSEKGCSPLSDIDGFYRFVMDSLPGISSKSQVYEKIRRLKKKFQVNSEKWSVNGEDPVFSKPHEHKLFELSKKIWGIDGGFISKTRAKPKIEVKIHDEYDEILGKINDFETLYPHWSNGLKSQIPSPFRSPEGITIFIKKNIGLIGEDKAKEMDEKWRAHFDNESDLFLRKSLLIGQAAEVVALSRGK